jgi:hypothetical protein
MRVREAHNLGLERVKVDGLCGGIEGSDQWAIDTIGERSGESAGRHLWVRKVQLLLHAYVPERKIAIKYVRGPQTFTCYLAARLNRTQLSAKKKRQKNVIAAL